MFNEGVVKKKKDNSAKFDVKFLDLLQFSTYTATLIYSLKIFAQTV